MNVLKPESESGLVKFGSVPHAEHSPVMRRADQIAVQIFPVFVVLYVTAFMMEMVEAWRYPAWTAAGIMLSLLTISLAKHRGVFLIFLILTTTYFLMFQFPDVANHVSLLIFCNVALILGLAYSYVSQNARENFPAYFEALLSPLRLMLIVTFTVAGFHKLNYDFLNPDVSCIRVFLGWFRWMLTAPLFHERIVPSIPVLAFLLLIAAAVALSVFRRRNDRSLWLFLVSGIALIVGASVSSGAGSSDH